MDINLPEVIAEVRKAFDLYETALVTKQHPAALSTKCSVTIRAPSATAR